MTATGAVRDTGGTTAAGRTETQGGTPAADGLADTGKKTKDGQDMTETAAIARKLFTALQDADVPVIHELIAEDLVDHSPMFGRNAFERENLKESAVRFKTAFPDVRIHTEHVLADGDKVLVHEIVTGTNTGPFGEQPPTGRTMRVQAAHILRIAGGRVVEHWSVRELETMRAALGIGEDGTPHGGR
ncbi:ester cyclase [Streptomyces sp. NPDC045470]|uniref:ester cyclase n=1 Tax=Streptomyces sp. NPDC045470 TaxID=3155469 RepID=UPI0033D322CB